VVDVLDHDRRPLRGDPAGEAAPDRDPHAGLDLLLEPLRRPRDQLLAGVVQQEERRGVGVEDVADPDEQLVEQAPEGKQRERRVGDGQELAEMLGRELACLFGHGP
jgi:hypothetical protein